MQSTIEIAIACYSSDYSFAVRDLVSGRALAPGITMRTAAIPVACAIRSGPEPQHSHRPLQEIVAAGAYFFWSQQQLFSSVLWEQRRPAYLPIDSAPGPDERHQPQGASPGSKRVPATNRG